jgi:hypothetical protein
MLGKSEIVVIQVSIITPILVVLIAFAVAARQGVPLSRLTKATVLMGLGGMLGAAPGAYLLFCIAIVTLDSGTSNLSIFDCLVCAMALFLFALGSLVGMLPGLLAIGGITRHRLLTALGGLSLGMVVICISVGLDRGRNFQPILLTLFIAAVIASMAAGYSCGVGKESSECPKRADESGVSN